MNLSYLWMAEVLGRSIEALTAAVSLLKKDGLVEKVDMRDPENTFHIIKTKIFRT